MAPKLVGRILSSCYKVGGPDDAHKSQVVIGFVSPLSPLSKRNLRHYHETRLRESDAQKSRRRLSCGSSRDAVARSGTPIGRVSIDPSQHLLSTSRAPLDQWRRRSGRSRVAFLSPSSKPSLNQTLKSGMGSDSTPWKFQTVSRPPGTGGHSDFSRDGGHTRHMWSVSILHTQVLR
jgi:hypothetical protein